MNSRGADVRSNAVGHDLIGRSVGDYQVLRRLGRGAMAEVFLAEQASLGRRVALKVLLPDLAADASYVRRFQHEAMAAAKLVHANIVQIFEVGVDKASGAPDTAAQGVHFIAQEYVPGQNLGEVVERNGPLDAAMVVAVLRQVAAALVKANEEGIVHRDIKPENLLLARSGEVKVADFGLARVSGADGVDMTQVGVTMGTPLYMSPEQVHGEKLDTRSDIYSLGATAYFLLAGRPPFHGETALAVAVQHVNVPAPHVEESRPDLPAGVAAMIDKMLAKKPKDRFADGRALLAELRRLDIDGDARSSDAQWSTAELVALADRPNSGTARLGELMKTAALARPSRKSNWIKVAAVAGCLAAGALAAAWMRGDALLAEYDATQATPRETVWAELFHAKQVDTEAAWLAVARLHPDADPYYHRLADVGRMRYYLFERPTQANLNKAIDIGRALSDEANADVQFQAAGLAGVCIAEARLGNSNVAIAAFERLAASDALFTALERFPGLERELRQTFESLRTQLKTDALQRYERLGANSDDEPTDE